MIRAFMKANLFMAKIVVTEDIFTQVEIIIKDNLKTIKEKAGDLWFIVLPIIMIKKLAYGSMMISKKIQIDII